ncbi:MAG: hypothetical protein ACE5JX_03445 [Acidobacteriota bacterium]
MKKRKRRTLSEIRNIREQLLIAVEQDGKVTLSQLVARHGIKIGVKNTPSDRNLVKKQLDQLAQTNQIQFGKVGRDLVAQSRTQRPETAVKSPPVVAAAAPAPAPVQQVPPANLSAIRAYAVQLEEFAKTLTAEIQTLVRMVEKAAG